MFLFVYLVGPGESSDPLVSKLRDQINCPRGGGFLSWVSFLGFFLMAFHNVPIPLSWSDDKEGRTKNIIGGLLGEDSSNVRAWCLVFSSFPFFLGLITTCTYLHMCVCVCM